MLAVLGRSWVLCWWSWAALELYVEDVGRSWTYVGGLGPKSGPGPSGNAIWQAAWAEKWPWPKREGDLVRPPDRPALEALEAGPDRSEAQSQFFQEMIMCMHIHTHPTYTCMYMYVSSW